MIPELDLAILGDLQVKSLTEFLAAAGRAENLTEQKEKL